MLNKFVSLTLLNLSFVTEVSIIVLVKIRKEICSPYTCIPIWKLKKHTHLCWITTFNIEFIWGFNAAQESYHTFIALPYPTPLLNYFIYYFSNLRRFSKNCHTVPSAIRFAFLHIFMDALLCCCYVSMVALPQNSCWKPNQQDHSIR